MKKNSLRTSGIRELFQLAVSKYNDWKLMRRVERKIAEGRKMGL